VPESSSFKSKSKSNQMLLFQTTRSITTTVTLQTIASSEKEYIREKKLFTVTRKQSTTTASDTSQL
jgi:hypothetical protein